MQFPTEYKELQNAKGRWFAEQTDTFTGMIRLSNATYDNREDLVMCLVFGHHRWGKWIDTKEREKVMSDTPDWLKNTETPASELTPQPSFTLAAPPAAVAANPAELPPPADGVVRIINPDDPKQYVDIEKHNGPAPEAPEQWTPEIEAMAEQLIAFKRFWQWPAGTRNELVSAKECATLFLDLIRNGNQSQ